MKVLDKVVESLLSHIKVLCLVLVLIFTLSLSAESVAAYVPPAPTNPQSSGIGLTGTIPSSPPTNPASIAVPSNGQTFTSLPITVSGICPNGLLIKLYINNVFAGSAVCTNGSYTITASLFNGENVLIVRDYDNLDQAGPDSNSVTVTYNNPNVGSSIGVTLTSSFAKLGAPPGSVLSWPITISGGSSPYALSVSWGDGSQPDLISRAATGSFNIQHTYATAGVYTILVKVTDANGDVAYLQLVGIASGAAGQSSSNTLNTGTTKSNKGIKLTSTTLLIIIALVIILPIITFFLGSRHRLASIKKRLERGEGLR